MFTGIIESTGLVKKLEQEGSNLHLVIQSPISHELKIDQSIAHNGVCLTVTALGENWHQVTAIAETLEKTNLNDLKLEDEVNLERCMPANGRFDGHIVQGHVDTTARLEQITDRNGSWELHFSYEGNWLTVSKGSICINGISLTVVNSESQQFSVAIIPYTWEHTNLRHLKTGDRVNLEFDILGKYIERIMVQRFTS